MNTPVSLKNRLRQIPFIGELNAHLKSRQLKRRYQSTVDYYAGQRQAGTFEELLKKRAGRFLDCLRTLARPPNIFYLGTDEQQDRSGILQALEKLGSLSYFTRSDGSYGHNDPRAPVTRRQVNASRLRELVENLHQSGTTPDILIAQSWGDWIDGKVFDELRERYGILIVNISMDDRHQYWGLKRPWGWGGSYDLIAHVDLAVTAAPECVDWYFKEGCPALFFPEASDPAIFAPRPELPKIHDVTFVGRRYGIRRKIVAGLQKAGLSVAAFGPGWENGPLAISKVPLLFAQSKVVLGIGTIDQSSDIYSLKMRDFDGPMSGSFYLTHDNPDLRLVYDIGEEIMTFRNIADCIEKAKYYLSHDVERERIAQAGLARAGRDHTWDKRFGALWDLLRSCSS